MLTGQFIFIVQNLGCLKFRKSEYAFSYNHNFSGPILESKDMRAIFQEKGKKVQNI